MIRTSEKRPKGSLTVGRRAPEATLQTHEGQPVTLTSYRGKVVVLYFYPKDDTPGCTKEACGFRDLNKDFEKAGAVIVGVSRDSETSHQQFREKYHLPFTLLSDPDAVACKAFGVWKQKSMYGRTYWGIERTTFVIDQAGALAAIFPKVKVEGHVDDVLDAIQSHKVTMSQSHK